MSTNKKQYNNGGKTRLRHSVAILLVLTTILSTATSASAAAPSQTPACDESYYATLDYYGTIKESSVVKSYTMNGAAKISDFGTYDEVSNLTDATEPSVTTGGSVIFDFGENAPDHFYFEGKTAEPFAKLPWTLDMSYKLNGVDTAAEDLAGKQGLVEIDLDIMPNEGASDYCKNNFILTALAAFNADDIISLSAPGAQVQLIGNIKAVLFMVLPGEEQHYTISVGSNEFTFSGMTFMAMPATLAQLSQIAELRDAKEKIEDSYDQISKSMDSILTTLEGMGSSLEATADGLDELNSARAEIDAGKDEIYANIDASVADLTEISNAIEPFKNHISTAAIAVSETTSQLTDLTETIVSMKKELNSLRSDIASLQDDMEEIQDMTDDIDDQLPALKRALSNMEDHSANLGSDMSKLKSSISTFKYIVSQLNGIEPVNENISGMTADQLSASMKQVKGLHSQYEAAVSGGQFSGTFEEFLNYLVSAGQMTSESAQNALALWSQMESGKVNDDTVADMNTASTIVKALNERINGINVTMNQISTPAGVLLNNLSSLCDTLGNDGLSGDLGDLSAVSYKIVNIIDKNDNTFASLFDDVESMGDTIQRSTDIAHEAIDQIAALDATLNKYEPSVQQALTDSQSLIQTMQDTVSNAQKLITSVTSLSKSSGTLINSGSEKTFTGLSDALRQSAKGLSETYNLRNAKNSITDLIDKEWDNYSGEINNLLLIDPDAQIVSMTSTQNLPPTSIQFIMRSEEITVATAEVTDSTTETTDDRTFFQRIVDMFKGIGNAVAGVF